jgi:hypothetical protein
MAQPGLLTREPRTTSDRLRRRTFAAAAVAALVIAIALKLYTAGPHGAELRPQSQRSAAIRTESRPSPGPAYPPSDVASGAASRSSARASAAVTKPAEAEPLSAPAVAPRTAAAVQGAAIAFLAGYLPYSYGRATARSVRRAAGRLRHELETAPPRVPSRLTRARARVITVRAQAMVGQGAADVVAVVDDGRRRYRIPLELRETGAGWLVTAIGG